MSSKIRSVSAREILDSRGNPTLEVLVETELGGFFAEAPSGASRGMYEAFELRDGGERYGGKGVKLAAKNVNDLIAPKLAGKNPAEQAEIDSLLCDLDGTDNKSKLGGNAITGVSMAVARAGAAAQKAPLWLHISKLAGEKPAIPTPCLNVINGGAHAGNELDFQEFMIMPLLNSFKENLQLGAEIYHRLKNTIARECGKSGTNVGDEGGFAPSIKFPEEALDLILSAVKEQKAQDKIKFIVDIAASQFFAREVYKTKMGDLTREALLNYYVKLAAKYPFAGVEDPFAEEDWSGWKLMQKLAQMLIIGDDLLVTNPERIKMAYERKVCNAAIIKINQIGTVSEAIEAAKLVRSFGWKLMVSHRSGDTYDDFIADFAVGIAAEYIKSGAPARGERVAKYNRLLKIEEEL